MTRIYLCIVSLLLLIYACSNDLESIGQDIVDNNNYIGSELVTVLNTATIRLDSFPTSSGTWGNSSSGSSVPKYIIVGKYDEPHGGTTTAVPCFQLDIPSDLGSPSFNAALDSAVFSIHLGSKIWGDTTYNIKSQGYNIYRLKELPEVVYSPTFNDYFYNISPVDYDKDSLIGRLEFLPKVEHINKAWARVDDNLAERMFYEMKFRSGKDSYYANTYAFRNFFKGLAIVPDETNDCLISLNAQDSLFMRFFYHDNGAERTTTFKVSRSEFLYNQYLTDLTDMLSEKEFCVNYYQLKLEELFIYLETYYEKYELSAVFSPLLGTDIDFINDVASNYQTCKSADELATRLKMSRITFNRRFMASFGTTASKWLRNMRSNELLKMIVSSDLSFTEIAFKIGFSSSAYLTEYCRKNWGKTPTQLRIDGK